MEQERCQLADLMRARILSVTKNEPEQNIRDLLMSITCGYCDNSWTDLNRIFDSRGFTQEERDIYAYLAIDMIEEAPAINMVNRAYQKAEKTNRRLSRIHAPIIGYAVGSLAGIVIKEDAHLMGLAGAAFGFLGDSLTGWPSKKVEEYIRNFFHRPFETESMVRKYLREFENAKS